MIHDRIKKIILDYDGDIIYILERLPKLENVAMLADLAYTATQDVDAGEGDGLYVSHEDLLDLRRALKELE